MRLVFDSPNLPPLTNAFSPTKLVQVKRDIVALLFTQMLERFDREEDFRGKQWQRLGKNQKKNRNAKIKNPAKKGNIKVLQDDGTLRQSWTQAGATGNEVINNAREAGIGTNIAYAGVHNDGLTINHPGTDNGFGKGIKIAPYKIEMPKRQMTGFSTQNEREIEELIDSHLQEAGGFR